MPSPDKYSSPEEFEKDWNKFNNNAINWYKNPPKRRKSHTDEQYKLLYDHWLKNAKEIKDRARRALGRKDVTPLTEAQIDN